MKPSPLSAFHYANALTYLSLLSAVGAIAAAFRGSAGAAGALIGISVIADTFDGRFARMFTRTNGEREFGVQLDSLSDSIAFGVAPCVCMTVLAPRTDGWLALAWWGAFAAFASCAITRLAFYNVMHERSTGFVGLPVPIAALVWSSLLLVHPSPLTSVLVLVATAAAMILPLPVPRPRGVALALFVIWPAIVVAAHVWKL